MSPQNKILFSDSFSLSAQKHYTDHPEALEG